MAVAKTTSTSFVRWFILSKALQCLLSTIGILGIFLKIK